MSPLRAAFHLLALEDVARVAYENGRRFGWLVQVTGHGTLAPATPGQN